METTTTVYEEKFIQRIAKAVKCIQKFNGEKIFSVFNISLSFLVGKPCKVFFPPVGDVMLDNFPVEASLQ